MSIDATTHTKHDRSHVELRQARQSEDPSLPRQETKEVLRSGRRRRRGSALCADCSDRRRRFLLTDDWRTAPGTNPRRGSIVFSFGRRPGVVADGGIDGDGRGATRPSPHSGR
jgi:hypothetical protein